MARVPLPLSRILQDEILKGPTTGVDGGCHRWLARMAGAAQRSMSAESCFELLRAACDRFVQHREIPDREIHEAVKLAYSHPANGVVVRAPRIHWPSYDRDAINRVLLTTPPLFSPTPLDISAATILPQLFPAQSLICIGPYKEVALIKPLEEWLLTAQFNQLIVPSPMLQLPWMENGKLISRANRNTTSRLYIIVEFDQEFLRDKVHQIQLLSWLARLLPIALAVDSAGKSIHGWFCTHRVTLKRLVRFFSMACLLGADENMWPRAQWCRLPGGMRPREQELPARQHIIHFNPQETAVARISK